MDRSPPFRRLRDVGTRLREVREGPRTPVAFLDGAGRARLDRDPCLANHSHGAAFACWAELTRRSTGARYAGRDHARRPEDRYPAAAILEGCAPARSHGYLESRFEPAIGLDRQLRLRIQHQANWTGSDRGEQSGRW